MYFFIDLSKIDYKKLTINKTTLLFVIVYFKIEKIKIRI